ncbi:MAG: ribonuclease III [Clostridia bacterium]|nr:ribonuclease III [Clostridia bacterium]
MEELFTADKIWTDEQIREVNPLELAFVGDAVFSLFVRRNLVNNHNTNTNVLSKRASKVVNAGAQYQIYRKIEPTLTEFETELCHRARNANIHSKAKNYSVTEYIYATAFEALLGYLYLTKKTQRLNQILQISVENL